MGDTFASGNWHVTQGKEQEFIERWTEFLGWTRETQDALISANLIQDERDPGHFISFAEWEDVAARTAWRETDGFQQHFGACRALCDDMQAGDYNRRASF